MDKGMCRICLAVNIRMHSIATTDLQLTYEKLTDHLLIKKARPTLACSICYTRLKNTHQLMIQCIESEKILTNMILQKDLQFNNELIEKHNNKTLTSTPVVYINIEGNDSRKNNSVMTKNGKVEDIPNDQKQINQNEELKNEKEQNQTTLNIDPHTKQDNDTVFPTLTNLTYNKIYENFTYDIEIISDDDTNSNAIEETSNEKGISNENNSKNELATEIDGNELCTEIDEKNVENNINNSNEVFDEFDSFLLISLPVPSDQWDNGLNNKNEINEIDEGNKTDGGNEIISDVIDSNENVNDDEHVNIKDEIHESSENEDYEVRLEFGQTDEDEDVDVVSLGHGHQVTLQSETNPEEESPRRSLRTRPSRKTKNKPTRPSPSQSFHRRKTNEKHDTTYSSSSNDLRRHRSHEMYYSQKHSENEKNRRLNLSILFRNLKDCIPALITKENVSKVRILRESTAICKKFQQDDLLRKRLEKKREMLLRKLAKYR